MTVTKFEKVVRRACSCWRSRK